MAGRAEIGINFVKLHEAEVPLSETEVLLGEVEGDKLEAVKVPQGEAEGVAGEAN